MLNNYISTPVVKLISNHPDYEYCCERLKSLNRRNKRLTSSLVTDTLKEVYDIGQIIPCLLDAIIELEGN